MHRGLLVSVSESWSYHSLAVGLRINHSVSLSLILQKKTTPALLASRGYSKYQMPQGILQTLKHQEELVILPSQKRS